MEFKTSLSHGLRAISENLLHHAHLGVVTVGLASYLALVQCLKNFNNVPMMNSMDLKVLYCTVLHLLNCLKMVGCYINSSRHYLRGHVMTRSQLEQI